ncbi:hypothetical protein TW80_02475 [Loktanella sp. S4079]|nr:hypothetical protein TW80_02475 [Loktanella sp. S4079]
MTRRFLNDEDGSVLIMTIVMLMVMLLVGGMAVDFMRFESRRAELQGVADRAVLAAANLQPSGADAAHAVSREEIAIDYFRKAGYEDAITDGPHVFVAGGNSSAYVEAAVDINTFYLRLAGIDHLSVPAASSAIQGNGNTEVSLVLDISGSMRFRLDSDTNASQYETSRMDELQAAARNFASKVLEPNGAAPGTDASEAEIAAYSPRVSLSLVSYSAHVNVGRQLFDQLHVDVDSATGWYGHDSNGNYYENGQYGSAWGTVTNPSTCVIFPESEYSNVAFTNSAASPLRHVAYADPHSTWRRRRNDGTYRYYSSYDDYMLCPMESAEEIIVHADQPDEIRTAISNLTPRASTSIHLGMKWGVTLLDPSMRDIVGNLPIHSSFAGHRPSNYEGTNDEAALKFVVLMTDGDNTNMVDMKKSAYNEAREIYRLSQWPRRSSDDVETITSGGRQDQLLQNICSAAKDEGIIVYTITMTSNPLPLTEEGAIDYSRATSGQKQMHDCASSPAHFYSTQNQDLSTIFDSIAEQITDLRLNL